MIFQIDIDWTPYIEESFNLFYPQITYYSLQNTSPADNLYGEDKNKTYQTYKLTAFIRVNPDEKLLTKFGYDTSEDVFIAIPKSILNTLGIQIKIGDKIEFNGKTYKITTYKEKHENDWKDYMITAVGKLDSSE